MLHVQPIGSPRDRFERSVNRLPEAPSPAKRPKAKCRGQQALMLTAAGYREPDLRSASYPFLPVTNA